MSAPVRYLPIEISGRLFGFPIASVLAVHGNESDSAEGESIMCIDLGCLFGLADSPALRSQTVILSTLAGVYAVRVDALHPIRTVNKVDAMPPLLAMCPFQGVVLEPDGLVLMIDPRQLIELVRRAVPEDTHEG
ncbi:MAG TPA: chemotaxis protein CheW [Aggregatilineaceae bacterium]|nr:chemotaxis protein CheW [Aggregatilineaceae bacterium]